MPLDGRRVFANKGEVGAPQTLPARQVSDALDEALDYRYHLPVLLEGRHLFSFHCTLILYAVELIINCHQLDIGTGWTKSRHCTLTASVADWVTIQRGQLDRFNAWTGGKLKIDGDMTLVLQLEETISKLSH